MLENMLEKMFLQILNMSYIASIVIILVLVFRLFLKRAPKIFSYILWGVVLLRLLFPFSFESVVSFLPINTKPIANDIVYMAEPKIDTGITIIDNTINSSLPAATPYASVNPIQIWTYLGSLIWVIGIVVLVSYSLFSLFKLRKALKNKVHDKENVYLVDGLETAFVLGIIKPRIYIPANLNDEQKKYILLHEQTHIKRFDHIVKLLAFIAVCLHWFNPLVWLAFYLNNKDMEMSCDESVIKKLGNSYKKDYSSTLLMITANRKFAAPTPLAFGESNTKSRIKNVLNYKKPAFWLSITLIIVVIIVAVGLLADPVDKQPIGENSNNNQTGDNQAEDNQIVVGSLEGLWKARTKYVGDNSAVGNIIYNLSFPEDVLYDGFQLYTDYKPYAIDIKLKTNDLMYGETGLDYNNVILAAPFQRNAIIMFSLIENVDMISFTIDDGQHTYYLDYTLDWAQDFIGTDNLFAKTSTVEGLGEFLKEASIKINEYITETYEKIAENEKLAEYEKATGLDNLGNLAGYIFIDGDKLYFKAVEIIKWEDTERLIELGLNPATDLPNGYYINELEPDTLTYYLQNDTKYTFTDVNLRYVKNPDGNRSYTTTNVDEFIVGSSYQEQPLTEQKIPYFVEAKDGKVIRIIEEFIFTQ